MPQVWMPSLDQFNEINHFQALDLYYTDTKNRYINCDLAHRRLNHISKKLTRKLVTEMFMGLILKGKESGNINRYNECITNQIKTKPFPKR